MNNDVKFALTMLRSACKLLRASGYRGYAERIEAIVDDILDEKGDEIYGSAED